MTSQDIVDTLGTIQETVDNASLEEINTLFADLREQYEPVQASETRALKRFLLAHNRRAIADEDRGTLEEFAAMVTSIQSQRAEMLIQAARYLSDEGVDVEALVEIVEETKNLEQELLDNQMTAENTEISVSLPARIELLAIDSPNEPIPKESDTDLPIDVVNFGDESSAAVQVDISTGAAVSVDPQSIDLGEITRQESTSVTLSGENRGSATVEVECSVDGSVRDFDLVQVQVEDKEGFIEITRGHINAGLTQISDENTRSIEKKLSNADSKLGDAISFIKDNKAKQADNMLNAAQNILEALLNQLDSQSNNGNGSQPVSDEVAFYVRQDTESAIDSVEEAKEAEI